MQTSFESQQEPNWRRSTFTKSVNLRMIKFNYGLFDGLDHVESPFDNLREVQKTSKIVAANWTASNGSTVIWLP